MMLVRGLVRRQYSVQPAGICHLSAGIADPFEYREMITRPSTTDVANLIALSVR